LIRLSCLPNTGLSGERAEARWTETALVHSNPLLGSILSLMCLDLQAKQNWEAGTALGLGQVLRARVLA